MGNLRVLDTKSREFAGWVVSIGGEPLVLETVDLQRGAPEVLLAYAETFTVFKTRQAAMLAIASTRRAAVVEGGRDDAAYEVLAIYRAAA